VLAYLPALRCGFIWDDDDYVKNNPVLRSPEGLRRIWLDLHATPQYYPLVHTSYWLEYRLWGLNPAGYHAVNICLHALAAVLAWRVLAFLQVPGAWVAAALFALHPVCVESVAWITERKNVLSTVFYLGAALAYLRYACGAEVAQRRGSSAGWYAAAFALFVCALLSKTVTCSLPAALLLVFWWQRKRPMWAALLGLVPLFVLGLVLGLLTVWLEKYQVRAAGEEWNLSLVERFLVAGRALWFYVGKLVWPARLTFIYPRWSIDAGAWWQYLYPAAALTALTALWLARVRIGRGPLVAVLFFAGTLLPALGFVDVYPMRYSFVADHFQYLASLGLIALGAAVGWRAARRLGRGGQKAGATVLVVVLATLGTLTWRQQSAYVNLESLWRDTLRKNPSAWIAHNNLGNILQARGQLDEALSHYRQALRTKPDDPRAHNNLAGVLTAQGRLAEAIEDCRAALRLQPDYAEAHCNLGIALAATGELREAIVHYRAALCLWPDFGQAGNNLAWILATCADPDIADPPEAVRLAEHAAELAGDRNPTVLDTLAAAYASAGQFDRAVATAQKARGLAVASGVRPLADAIAARLALYQQGQAYRAPPARRGE
jgi:tetratricopeptide (TPR) repeat protein